MSNYKFKGVYIPAFVWLNKDLTPTQKMLLCEIDAMSDGKNNPCFAKNEHFANHLGIDIKSTSNMIGKLIKLGYVERDFTDKKTFAGRTMWTVFSKINTPPSENVTPPSDDVSINTPINSLIKKPLNNSSRAKSEKRVLFNSFRREFISSQGCDLFHTEGLGWLPETSFVLNADGLIFNTVSQKILTKEESYKIWNYLYENKIAS